MTKYSLTWQGGWSVLIGFLLLLVGTVQVQAQRPSSTFPGGSGGGRPTTGSGQGGNNQRGGNSTQREVAPDTFGVFVFQVGNPNEELAFEDTLLTEFQQYDPTRKFPDDYANLGLPGSAHQQLVYTGRDRGGLDLGWNQYDLYYTTGKNLPYYRLERPFTNLSFMQGSTQRDNLLQADFSRNFANGLNYTLRYSGITQEGARTHYPNQRNNIRSLATGLWFHSKRGRYDGFFSYASNVMNAQENGGIINLPETGGEFSSPATADVYLTNASSRHDHKEWMYTQYYRIGGQIDSTGRAKRAFTLSHQLDYDRSTYRFDDAYDESDRIFYERFPELAVDTFRGVRYFINHRTLENSFRLSTFRLTSGNRQAERQQRDLIEVGLTHRYHRLQIEPTDTTINNLLLTGKVGLRPGERLRLQVEGLLAIFDQAGDYRVNAKLDVDLGKAGTLALDFRNQLYSPTVLQTRFLLSQKVLYTRNFARSLDTRIGASYTVPKLDVQLAAQYHLLSQFIYFDSTSIPQQRNGVIPLLQFAVQKDFRFGVFRLLNRVTLQQTEADELRLPTLFAKHSFIYEDTWFQVLDMQMGIDARYATAYQPNYYNPFVGQFQLQNRQTVDLVPGIDAFFNMKVKTFRAFFKMENLYFFVADDERLFQTAFYPWPEAAFRFGINWRMID
ncbi:MAG: putative porin [Bacteroidota bacterium]